jgi:hypothetical protein
MFAYAMQTACPVTCGLCPTSSTGSPTGGAGGDYGGSPTGDYGGSPTGDSGGGSMYGDAAGTNCADFEFEPSQCTAANGCKLDGTACLRGRDVRPECEDVCPVGLCDNEQDATKQECSACHACHVDGAGAGGDCPYALFSTCGVSTSGGMPEVDMLCGDSCKALVDEHPNCQMDQAIATFCGSADGTTCPFTTYAACGIDVTQEHSLLHADADMMCSAACKSLVDENAVCATQLGGSRGHMCPTSSTGSPTGGAGGNYGGSPTGGGGDSSWQGGTGGSDAAVGDCAAAGMCKCKEAEAECHDNEGWTNSPDMGLACAHYKSEGFCRDGMVLEEWATGAAWNHPEVNCCACGGGKASAMCTNMDGWTNGAGANCDTYSADNFCAAGKVLEAWTVGADWNHPEMNCCACGGGRV